MGAVQASIMERPGPREVLTLVDWPDPAPTTGRVLVEVRARGLNRSELSTRQGHSGDAVPLPRVLAMATPVLQAIVERVESGRSRPNVWRTYSFDELPAAHDDMEHSRAAGKLVVAES